MRVRRHRGLVALPRHVFGITCCLSGFRSAGGYVYQRAQGFDELKTKMGRLDQMAGAIIPARFFPRATHHR